MSKNKNKKIKVEMKDLFDVKYGNALADLKAMLQQTKAVLHQMLHDEEEPAPFVSAGQVVGLFWCEVISRVVDRQWDVYFAAKSIEALGKLLPASLTENEEFTAGFDAVLMGLTGSNKEVLEEMGVRYAPQEVN
tara:strand:+ start:1334 stop:1735 length:402 start_codon:yes stop_codon:yes gene_type:complete